MTKKYLTVHARLDLAQAEYFKKKMELWKLSPSDTIRKILSDQAMIETDPWRYLSKALAWKKAATTTPTAEAQS